MIISSRRIVIKTCGRTSLLPAIPHLLAAAETYCSLSRIDDIFYTRKHLARPEEQRFPHRSFVEEVQYLDTLIRNGAAHALGRINSSDVWYLYTNDPGPRLPASVESDQVGDVCVCFVAFFGILFL